MKTFRGDFLVSGTSMTRTTINRVNVPTRQRGFFAVGVGLAILAVVGGTSATMVAVQNERDNNAVAATQPLDASPVVASLAPHGSGNE